jgi:hypothetical protein
VKPLAAQSSKEEAEAVARLWQGPTLVLDAATARVHAGILADSSWTTLEAIEGEALETIFTAVDRSLAAAGLALAELRGVALGVGPGSILGLRLALIALRAWQQLPVARGWTIARFRGLELHGQLLALDAPTEKVHLLTGFRRGSWHHLAVEAGRLGPLEVIDDDTLAGLSGNLHYVPTGRAPATLPAGARQTPFSLAALPRLAPAAWARPVSVPELYLPDPPRFARWSAERHR